MKVPVAPRFLARFIANLAAIIAVCVIFAAGATRAGVAENGAGESPARYAETSR